MIAILCFIVEYPNYDGDCNFREFELTLEDPFLVFMGLYHFPPIERNSYLLVKDPELLATLSFLCCLFENGGLLAH